MARQFGATWWGKAWVTALETHIMSDKGRLSRGRTYARQGRVSMPDILPGSVRAEVQGKEQYVADLSVRLLGDQDWDQLAQLIADRSAHAAALLSGELPSELLAEARRVGIEILPASGEVLPDCTCPDWGDPCKHAAALAYLLADAIDQDPFVLLLLRGRGRTELLDSVRRRRSGGNRLGGNNVGKTRQGGEGAGPAEESKSVAELAGVLAGDSYDRVLGPLPSPLAVPPVPGAPVALAAPPPIDSGLRLSELESLATDAAIRATDLLHQDGSSGLELDAGADLARRAAEASYSGGVLALAEASAIAVDELVVRAIAWDQGGIEGLAVATQSWEPAPSTFQEARLVIGPRSRTSANTVSGNGIQLRVDRSGNWWRFRPDPQLGWVLASQGFADPAELMDT